MKDWCASCSQWNDWLGKCQAPYWCPYKEENATQKEDIEQWGKHICNNCREVKEVEIDE